ncbi:MAG: helicase-related protein [Pseudomonadota bacterium]|nr:helicase-related protein [Pseudomonadota bacterium]
MNFKNSSKRIRAILGPTNTGKTYFAIERMLGYSSGMIGFPLRLLARENYDRILSIKGRGAVALITGEEKIIPPNPQWFVCTVESMPMDRPVDFLAIDEIQLCGDAERGHIFTQRLLNSRGHHETMFLGAETIKSVIRKLVPDVEIEDRSRLSKLRYSGAKKITRLPRRSAIVAFSANEVYSIAELVRRQRGGTAVVLGALSPRTRNAQVALYQKGEVDYMVATDAIGMGLNMHVDHVAFAGFRKFDGKRMRQLSPAEIGQVAGRAGRYMNDGTFGVTNDIKPLAADIVDVVENHNFEALKTIFWRNSKLDYKSPRNLLKSLEILPPRPELMPSRVAEDHEALLHLSNDTKVKKIATSPDALRRLWEVCQIPDFRKTLVDNHFWLLREIYLHLNQNYGRLPEDWVAAQIGHLDNENGGIDTLTVRIAHIRTWTYISHRAEWLDNSIYWQERTRNIEDRLSDLLHKKLAQRFIDRKAAMFHRKRDGGSLLTSVTANGILQVEGEKVGRLEGLKFIPSDDALGDKAIMSAALRGLRQGMKGRVASLVASCDDDFGLSLCGVISWRKSPIARLKRGSAALKPGVLLDRNENIDNQQRQQIEQRIARWLFLYLQSEFEPLTSLLSADCPASVRGLLFRVAEGLGSTPRNILSPQLNGIDLAGRKFLKSENVKVGISSIYIPELITNKKVRLRALLWATANQHSVPAILFEGRRAGHEASKASKNFWLSTGHFTFGDRALRIDRVEKLASILRRRGRQGPFLVTPDLLGLADCNKVNFAALAKCLGYRTSVDEMGLTLKPRAKAKRKLAGSATRHAQINSDSPFAALKDLIGR